MPELTPVHIALLFAMVVVGAIVGWIYRGKRSVQEKAAVSAGWQDQLDAQRVEHDRLTEQNKNLMEQVSQLQASNRDSKNRAKELSEVVREAFTRRDELQREIKDIRGHLETAMTAKSELQSSIDAKAGDEAALHARDKRIAKLETELENWQNRLPPLIERFRVRNEEAEQLEADLAAARERIQELEAAIEHGQTRIEPVNDPDELTDGREASNDAIEGETDDDDVTTGAANDASDEVAEELAEEAAEEIAEQAAEDVTDDDVEQAFDADAELEPPEDYDPINGHRDKLQQIKGVGPAIEKTLNELGIFRFQQIAEMSEYDIDRVANRLKGFRSRIYREDWIGQARELRDQQIDG